MLGKFQGNHVDHVEFVPRESERIYLHTPEIRVDFTRDLSSRQFYPLENALGLLPVKMDYVIFPKNYGYYAPVK